MSRFRLAPQANVDLDQIWHYVVRKSSQEMANRLIDSLSDRIGVLCSTPLAGRSREEMAPGLRSFPCGEYYLLPQGARPHCSCSDHSRSARSKERVDHSSELTRRRPDLS
jgi:toxin ParE1/3/4